MGMNQPNTFFSSCLDSEEFKNITKLLSNAKIADIFTDNKKPLVYLSAHEAYSLEPISKTSATLA